MKTNSDGRRYQKIKSGIYQEPLIGSSSNFKLKLRGPNQNRKLLEMKTTSNGRKKVKVEYLSNLLFDPLGKIIENPRGNVECGSAQPSLFFIVNNSPLGAFFCSLKWNVKRARIIHVLNLGLLLCILLRRK